MTQDDVCDQSYQVVTQEISQQTTQEDSDPVADELLSDHLSNRILQCYGDAFGPEPPTDSHVILSFPYVTSVSKTRCIILVTKDGDQWSFHPFYNPETFDQLRNFCSLLIEQIDQIR